MENNGELHIPVTEPEFEATQLVVGAKNTVTLTGKVFLSWHGLLSIDVDDFQLQIHVPSTGFPEPPKEGQRVVVTISIEKE